MALESRESSFKEGQSQPEIRGWDITDSWQKHDHCHGRAGDESMVPKEFGSAPTFYDSATERVDQWQKLIQLELALIQLIEKMRISMNLPEFPNWPDGPNTPDKPNRPDKPTKPENPETPDKPNKPDKPDKPDTPDKPNKPDKPDKPDTPDKPDKPNKPEKPTTPEQPDQNPRGTKIWGLDFSNGIPDKNINHSMDDNKTNFGGSHVTLKTLADGRQVGNFSVDRWPNLPKGWEHNHPANVSDAEVERLKETRSFRAELTSYQEEDRLKPGHTYDMAFNNQLVKWDADKSEWGDLFWQMHQSAPYGVPELGLGTHKGKYAVTVDGKWHDLDNLPPVDQTIGDWQKWNIRISMPEKDGARGSVQFMHDGKVVYSVDNWELKTGYGQGNPYVKFGIYKAVYHQDDHKKYEATGGSRFREQNVDNFAMTDIS
jgi:hypothetical protein